MELELWQALNIYDDFLDQEGSPSLLPLANIYFSNFIIFHYKLMLPEEFYSSFENIIKRVEIANRQELLNQRLKIIDKKINIPIKKQKDADILSLSNKSLSLALSPLALLLSKNYISKNNIKDVLEFFRYLLSAKQLSDDAKDWQKDINQGRVNYVTNLILEATKKSTNILDLNNTLLLLGSFINIAPTIAKKILKLCLIAKRKAKKLGIKENTKIIINIINPLEKGAKESLKFYKLIQNN